MPKYAVWGLIPASTYLGEVEADSPEEAKEKALDLDCRARLCHQCANHLTIDDPYDFDVDEIKE